MKAKEKLGLQTISILFLLSMWQKKTGTQDAVHNHNIAGVIMSISYDGQNIDKNSNKVTRKQNYSL